ncbi:Arm DNA-binding domain-containing protein [Rhodoferax antarcticus]|uniref:Arm DNA-binding domain-containing protein n=1 Tax=Rhodoferax antarcticus TaxID=81479 RepID=UPI000AC058E6
MKNVKHTGAPAGDKHTDGAGMYLLVNSGGKYWRINYRFADKRKTLALGVYPDVGLADEINAKLVAYGSKKIKDASNRGKAAANALHDKPNRGRVKRAANCLPIWWCRSSAATDSRRTSHQYQKGSNDEHDCHRQN